MRRLLCALLLLAAGRGVSAAELKLPALLSNGMVLQRDREVPVWGMSKGGADVTVAVADEKLTAKADAHGKWRVNLPPQKAGGPHAMTIASGDEKIELKDVYFGEVWLASGQSNMHWTFSHNIKDKEKELDASADPLVRQFTVKKGGTKEPAADVAGQWLGASRENLLIEGTNGSSAVGYFFARALRKELNVPVGIINSSVGGTPIEHWSPGGVLYNAMIHPLAPYSIRGAIWYQGESNVFSGAGMKYADLTKTQVEAWRKLWGNDFPYYFVQIAPYTYTAREKPKVPTYALPEFWQAQTTIPRVVPNTGMVVITDLVDNVRDIHPANKQDVGLRLARLALARDYGQSSLVVSGPTFKEASVEGASIRVRFDSVGGGLASRDDMPLTHFLLAGEDKVFHPASASIDGDTVVVRSAKVVKPLAVRFAWDETAMPNFMNKEGLPANSFRSDDWKLAGE